jgi:hypothetical protein
MAKLLVFLIRFYQAHLAIFYRGACIYTPSCSEYSMQSIIKHGAWAGTKLSINRLKKCRPPYEGGNDPVE